MKVSILYGILNEVRNIRVIEYDLLGLLDQLGMDDATKKRQAKALNQIDQLLRDYEQFQV